MVLELERVESKSQEEVFSIHSFNHLKGNVYTGFPLNRNNVQRASYCTRPPLHPLTFTAPFRATPAFLSVLQIWQRYPHCRVFTRTVLLAALIQKSHLLFYYHPGLFQMTCLQCASQRHSFTLP